MRRFTALDALRGLAILGMCLSGRIPWDGLPAWMYHAQEPPPSHEVSQVAFGITWVDLVFPFFLFAMGAAIPLSLSRRLDKDPIWKVVLSVLSRGLMLGFFAVIVQHFRPEQIAKEPHMGTWWLAIGLFMAVVLAYAQWPKKVPPKVQTGLRVLGWAVVIGALILLPYRDEKGFSPEDRADIILMILANVSISGGLIWLFTRGRSLARIGWIGIALAIFLASEEPGWAQSVWNWTPLSWAYQFEFQKYLLLVLPGTFCGELFLQVRDSDAAPKWAWPRLAIVAFVGLSIQPLLLIGLHGRELLQMPLIALALSVGCVVATANPGSAVEQLLNALVRWASFLLMIGLLVEPLGGGIRKDSPTTLSYFFICAGMAAFLLAALTVLIDAVKNRQPFRFLSDVGANPMLGYVAITNISGAIFMVSHIEDLVAGWQLSPWQGVAYAGVKTLFVGLIAMLGTRAGFFLRA